jgi:4-hydroxythreonine-4-phosphate dehydrogenase
LAVRKIDNVAAARFLPGVLDVLDPGTLQPQEIERGRITAASGRAVVQWWQLASKLALAKEVGAAVKGPVSKEAIALGVGSQPEEAPTYLFLITGHALRVAHLTDHVPLSQAIATVTQANVLQLIELVDASLRSWGFAQPRIGVAGINPHAQGLEETREIAPAVAQARALGIDASGPISPDTVFRQGIEGVYDCIVAHYHDQGHIAIKTWKFDGNCALNLGSPFIRLSVPHGPGFDIAGRGVADSRSMLQALRTAASLAAGRGFAQD